MSQFYFYSLTSFSCTWSSYFKYIYNEGSKTTIRIRKGNCLCLFSSRLNQRIYPLRQDKLLMFKDFSEPYPLSLKLVQTVSHNFFQGSETLPWHTYRCLMTFKFGLLSCYLSECAIDNRDVTHSRFSKWQIFEKKEFVLGAQVTIS